MKTLLSLLATLLAATIGWSFAYIRPDDEPTALPLKWDPGTVPLRIMLGTDRTLSDGSNFSTSAQAAAQAWNTRLGNLQFQIEIVAAGSASRNNVNELAFATDIFGQAFGSGVLAVTTTRFSANERTTDTLFNSAISWDSYRGPLRQGGQDLQRVALHELGHNLGLDHPDDEGQSVVAVMNSRISSLDSLSSDDTTGVQNLYGVPGVVPGNNDFANATVITLGAGTSVSVSGSNVNATKQSGEPNHAGNAGGRSVWWRWTPTADGTVNLDTRGSYCDTTLGVYTGSAISSLVTIASNDDLQAANPHIQASLVTFVASAGTTYFFAVDGFDADSAGLTLNLSTSAPPAGIAPTITAQPANQTVTVGGSASFSVSATGTPTLTYQWSLGGAALSGATSSTLSLSNVQSANAGSYSVTVTNGSGSATSGTATLTVNAAPPPPPPITGGGGGGAPSVWFLASLSLLALGRLHRSRH